MQDIWLDFRDAHNQNIAITGYPTEKNPGLLARIIEASSDPGDLVLDCFSGSGTTLAVASQLNRKWLGIDNSLEAISTTLRRFAKGLEPMGDFVAKQEPQTKEKPIQTSLLWDNAEETEKYNTGVSENTLRITDFAFYTSEPPAEQLDGTLKQWLEWQ